MSDAKTELFPGAGGSQMDESAVTTTAGSDLRRPRVVPGADNGDLQSWDNEGGKVKAHVKDLSAIEAINNIGSQFPDDGFGRLRVSEPRSLIEITHQYDLSPGRMGAIESGGSGGTVVHATPHAILSVGSVGGHTMRHRSHRYTVYQPGKSMLVRMTGQLGNGTALAWMGYGDSDDGVFLERDNTGVYLNFKSSVAGVADQRIAQASWSDPLNGAGTSGKTLDPSKSQQLVLDFQWLGVGTIRAGLTIDGELIHIHSFHFANTTTGAYMRTASLPVEWGIQSLGTAASMTAICAAVISEGGHDPFVQFFSESMTASKALLGAGVRTPLIAVRPAILYNGIANHGYIAPIDFSAIAISADNVLLELVRNPTSLTASSFGGVGGTSLAEFDIASTAITGGTVIWGGFITSQLRAAAGALNNLKDIPLVVRADGTQETIVLCATRIAGATSLFGGINWQEVR